MSRTKKGSKSPGYDYWSKRPGPTNPGRFAKQQCHRIERRIAKKSLGQKLIEALREIWEEIERG